MELIDLWQERVSLGMSSAHPVHSQTDGTAGTVTHGRKKGYRETLARRARRKESEGRRDTVPREWTQSDA